MSRPEGTGSPLYELRGVRQVYDGRGILDIPSLQIDSEQIFALVGPSGAGKSTLLRLLGFLEAPAAGSVAVRLGNGRLVTHRDVSIQDRRKISMVFQRPVLLSRSVRSNVAYGLRLRGATGVEEKVAAVLERIAMRHLAEARPDTLSGGELQRVAVARALVLEPEVLLLDEPTANLDPYNVGLIERLLKEQNEAFGTTIVLVTHNVFQAKRMAARVGLLLAGELIEIAPTGQFFNAPADPRTDAFLSGELVY